MKKRNLILLAGAVVLLSACIPSVNPYYTARDLVYDSRLVGEWQETGNADQPETWKFEKSGDKAYKLTVTEKGNPGEFAAHLFQLKEKYFLDLIPAECNYATNQADLVSFSMFPGHLLVEVGQIEPELKLALFNFEWLGKYLDKNPQALAHRVEGKTETEQGVMLLTASTGDLQRFVLKHMDEGELFDKPGVMVRKTGNTPAAALR